jgi:hypothetical protein
MRAQKVSPALQLAEKVKISVGLKGHQTISLFGAPTCPVRLFKLQLVDLEVIIGYNVLLCVIQAVSLFPCVLEFGCFFRRPDFFSSWTRPSPPFPDRLLCFSLSAEDSGGFSQRVDGLDHEVLHSFACTGF